MLRSMVSQATGGTSAELEAITAERDFFREKYAEQIDAMEEMKTKLKESQRVIDRLRSQVLDLELEKSKRTSSGRQQQQQQMESPGSTNTSVTALTCDDDATTKSGVENVVESTVERASGDSAEEEISPSTECGPAEVSQDVDEDEQQSVPDDSDEEGSDEEEESEAESEDDEAAKVRAQAERMLLWANYQTSKRPTPNTSLIQDDDNDDDDDDESKADSETRPEGGVSGEIVYDLPTSLDKRRSSLLDDDDDDESTLGSSSRHHAEPSVSSNSRTGSAGGKIGTLFNKLQDMIDPPSESDSDGESFASES